jgi:membrane fusion protein, heavy metal efflux system
MNHNHWKSIAALALALAFPFRAYSHEGHNKAPGQGGEAPASGPIAITTEAKRNLALVVEEAQLRRLEKTFMVIGRIEPIPNRIAALSSRIPGRVTDVKTAPNEKVTKGQVLVEVESRQLGDPPPRVQLVAPMTGIVMDRHVVLGDTVEPDKHLLEIVDLSEVYAEGQIFEGQVAWVKAGQKVRIGVESYPTNTFIGTVDLIGGALDPEARTLKVWARIPNPEGVLRPNMRARLNIVTAEADTVVTVPHATVLGEAGHWFVFVQSDTDELVYEKKPVVLGMKDDRYYEVIEGVFPGDKVVTLGNYQLQYVTTRKAVAKPGGEKPGASTNVVAGAKATEPGHDAEEAGHSHVPTLPLWAMGLTLGVLLLLNLMVMLFRRGAVPSQTVGVVPPPTTAPAGPVAPVPLVTDHAAESKATVAH